MGNRYRCAGTTSETYINGVMTNDRVDIKTLFLPTRCIENAACFAELNNKIYIANMTDYPASESYIYTFDGDEFERVVTFPLTEVQDICNFNNVIYFCDNIDLYRIDGDTVTAVTTIPENDGKNDYRLFSLGQYMYLLESRFPDPYYEPKVNNKIYRFTGSGWTQVVEFSGVLQKPTCILFRGAIHILSYCWPSEEDPPGWWQPVLSNIHKTFNGVSISDSPVFPGEHIMRNATYIYNNKLRVFQSPEWLASAGKAWDFDGTNWESVDVFTFDGWMEITELARNGFQAFIVKGRQFIFNVRACMMMEISNPIKLSQYFVS